MRDIIIAGNWKMNTILPEAEELAKAISLKCTNLKVKVVLCVPYTFLLSVAGITGDKNSVYTGAQDCSSHDFGAYTGEISAEMLKSIGVQYCIVGHSERRMYHSESGTLLVDKMKKLIRAGINPIWCCGEQLSDRDMNKHFETVYRQMATELFLLNQEEIKKVTVAYEPVWAIGTGRTATANQAAEMHTFIRQELISCFGNDLAAETSILYGGSCNEKNAGELFKADNVDGGLVGGASLKADSFLKIIEIANELH